MSALTYKDVLKAIDSHQEHNTSYTKEPTWVLSISDPDNPANFLTSSENKLLATGAIVGGINLANTTPIHEYEFCISRRFNPSSVTGLFPGALYGHELKISAAIGSISPRVYSAFTQNVLLNSVQLLRLAISSNKILPKPQANIIAAYKFTQVYITSMRNEYDCVALSIRYLNLEYNKSTVDPRTGIPNGLDAAAYHNLSDGSAVL
jgi:hypothetical protein